MIFSIFVVGIVVAQNDENDPSGTGLNLTGIVGQKRPNINDL